MMLFTNFRTKNLVLIVIFLCFACETAFSQSLTPNLLKAVAIQYKVRSKNPSDNLDFSKIIYAEDAKDYTIIAGEERNTIQPVAIFQNVSTTDLTFQCRLELTKINSDKPIYRKAVPISKECLSLPDNEFCYESDETVRYCSVTENDKGYDVKYLPFPGDEQLTGIPPGGYVEVQFPRFEPNEYIDKYLGYFTATLYIIPVEPETGDTLKEEDFSDDTVKTDLFTRVKYCIELFYPDDGDTINYSINDLMGIYNNKVSTNVRIEISRDANFNVIDTIIEKSAVENFYFLQNTKYYWRMKANKGDSACISETRCFYTDKETAVNDYQYIQNGKIAVYPNPASDYIEIYSDESLLSTKFGTSDKIIIFNNLGESVLMQDLQLTSKQIIDISKLSKGSYFVKIGSQTICFVKI